MIKPPAPQRLNSFWRICLGLLFLLAMASRPAPSSLPSTLPAAARPGLEVIRANGQPQTNPGKWLGGVKAAENPTGTVLMYLAAVGLLVAAVAALLLIWTFSLRKQVAQRTKNIGAEILERKKAEQALQKSESLYRVLTETIRDVVWTLDPETLRYRYISPAVEKLLGYSVEEILLRPAAQPQSTGPGECLILLAVQRAATIPLGQQPSGLYYTDELELIRKDGTRVWVEVVTTSYTNLESGKIEIHGVTRDISERKQMEAALRESSDKLALLFNLLPVGISVLNREGKIVLMNPALEKILGTTQEELQQGSHLNRRYYRADGSPRPIEEFASSRILKGETQALHVETGVEKENGELVWTDVSAVACSFSDWQTLSVTSDITERRKTEEQIRAGQAELQRMLAAAEQSRHALLSLIEDQKEAEEKIRQLNRQLEQRVIERTSLLTAANQELEAFAYSVSHDLRAPLRAMDGYSSILLSDYAEQVDETGQHYLARIQEASRRMGQLINDLLNLSRVTRSEFRRSQVDLSALAQSIAADLKAQSPNRQVTIEIAPGMIADGDANLLRIVLENLLHNALKFTGKRENALIQIGSLEKEGETVFYIRDNGAGFNMEYASKLFTPFHRLHGEKEFSGTGIGLSLVQRIILRHGGRIWPEAALDKGATFLFTLGNQR